MSIDILDILSPHRPFSFNVTPPSIGGPGGKVVLAIVYQSGGVIARIYVPGSVETEVFS